MTFAYNDYINSAEATKQKIEIIRSALKKLITQHKLRKWALILVVLFSLYQETKKMYYLYNSPSAYPLCVVDSNTLHSSNITESPYVVFQNVTVESQSTVNSEKIFNLQTQLLFPKLRKNLWTSAKIRKHTTTYWNFQASLTYMSRFDIFF